MNWAENVERAGILMMLKFLKTRLVESTQRESLAEITLVVKS